MMTSYFQIMVPMGQHQRHGYGLLSLPGAHTGGKVSVYNDFYMQPNHQQCCHLALLSVSNLLDFKSLKMSADFIREITVHCIVLAAKTWMSMNTGSDVNLCLTKHGQECEKKYPLLRSQENGLANWLMLQNLKHKFTFTMKKMWSNYQYTRILLQFLLLNASINCSRQTHKIMQMFTDICSDMHIDNIQTINKTANILAKQVYSLNWCV